MDQQCGNTWLQTLKAAETQYNINRQLPFISVVTWNDYEEGTEIETGIDNCLSVTASVSGDVLSWTPSFSKASGSEETVHHYDIYDSPDGESLTLKATLAVGSRSVDLRSLNLGNGTHRLYVHAVGKPSIINKLSNAAAYTLSAGVSLTPTTLAFSTTLVSTTSAAKTVTVKNTGNTALGIQSITISGEYTQANNCPASLAAQASCQVQVSFKPTGINTRSGALSVLTNASTTASQVSLTGVGTYVKLSPTSLAFGSRTVGSTSSAQTVTLTNTATYAVKITGVSIASSFLQSNNCGSQVAAKGSCTFSVRFRPTSKGTKTGALNVYHYGGGSPSTVTLSGTGL
jgi:hypothetical protein